ncbi:UDP-glycosyltransferase UGT5 [Drosophila tropicalis]|uniref:UDP-glycosyltransferase UGT5 n=1 Tax=Drosophila tropicalis TaxID=46794 RepID=UPI0035AB7A34
MRLKFRPVILAVLSLVAVLATPSEGANILGLFSSHSQSHLILHMSVAKALAKAGHNVTVVSMLEPKVKSKDIHVIVIPVTDEQEAILEDQMKEMASQKNTIFDTMNRLLSGMTVMIESQYELLSHPKFQQIYETKFDLMIMGWFINDFQLGVAAKLKVPVIIDWMNAPMPVIDGYVANPSELSYVPSLFTGVAKGEVMGFRHRLQNYVSDWLFSYLFHVFDIRLTRYYNEQFGKESNFPTLAEMRRNVSLVFVNCHLNSEGPIRPLVPATVQIGGIQIKDTPDPLPKDIEEFLSKSEHGAILLSMGSNIKSSAVKPELNKNIFNVLSKLKQNVIWKWENLDDLPGKSANIFYTKWLPQDDILAHPNTKLFITHAGKGGITEAQYHGVPMVALPIFGDQPGNAEKMQNSGYGLSLDLLTLTEENFAVALREVLENEKYAQAVGQFSALYRDRPLTASQEVVYWTEYILRHKGAPHLQSPRVHMNTIAAYNLDVYALLITVLIISLLLTTLAFKFVLRKVFAKASSQKNSKKLKKQ